MTIRTLLFTGTTALALGVASVVGAQEMNRSGTAAPGAEMTNPATGNTGAAADRAGSAISGTLTAAENRDLMVQPFNKSVRDIRGMDVVGSNNQKIGDVDNVLIDSAGQAKAVSIEAGGFLGMGTRQVVIQLSDLTLQDDRLVSNMTKEQISGLPEWND